MIRLLPQFVALALVFVAVRASAATDEEISRRIVGAWTDNYRPF